MDDKTQTVAGLQEKEPKNKNLAILLALFAGFFVWAYTYQKDKWRFWVGLSITVTVFVVLAVIMVSNIASFERAFDSPEAFSEEHRNITNQIRLALPLILVPQAVWVWGVVDAVRRSAKWYRNYPDN